MSDDWKESGSEQGESCGYSFWAEQISKENKETTAPGDERAADSFVEPVPGSEPQHTVSHSESRTTSGQGEPQGSGTEHSGAADTAADPESGRPVAPDEPLPAKKHGVLRRTAGMAGKAVVFGLVAGAAFFGFQHVYYRLNPDAQPISLFGNDPDSSGDQVPQLATTALSDVVTAESSVVQDLVERVERSVVSITSTVVENYTWFGQSFSDESFGSGSGIICGSNDTELLIATNDHVIADASEITVQFMDGTEETASVKGSDSVSDLAILSIPLEELSEDTMDSIQIASLGDSDSVKVGEMVIAIGNALGYGQSTTVGYISAKDREVTVEGNTMILLQTDAAINPGNSGGALINIRGEVIGINSVKYASNDVEGIGFAIPISSAYPILNEFMNRESLSEDEQGYLGVTIQNVTEELAELYQWPIGARVYDVVEGGPADEAGILAQDIITAVDGIEVTSADQLKERVNSLRIGTEVTITLQRYVNGSFQEMEFTVVLAANPQPTAIPTPTPQAESEAPSIPSPDQEEPEDGEVESPSDSLNTLPYRQDGSSDDRSE